MKEELILEGNLKAILLPDLLTFLSMVKKTGRLELQQDSVEKTLFWKKGEIVFAHSTDREESLGLFLLRNGKISEEEYRTSLETLKPGVKHGRALVKMGYITPKDLWWGVKHQVLEIIYSTFSWNEGTFYFYEMPEAMVRQTIVIGASTTSLIMEGIRRLDEWARIRGKIPRLDTIFSRLDVPAEIREGLELSPLEERLLELVQVDRTLQDLIRLSDLTEFDTSRILYTLLSAQLIAVHEKPKDRELEAEDAEMLRAIIRGYANLYSHMYRDLVEAIGPDNTAEIFAGVLKRQSGSSDLFYESAFDDNGMINEGSLIANVAELTSQERMIILDDALNTLLSYLLFEVSQHLPVQKKEALYHDVSERKAELEKLIPVEDLLT